MTSSSGGGVTSLPRAAIPGATEPDTSLAGLAELRRELAARRARLNRSVGEAQAAVKRAKAARQKAEEAEALAAACEDAARLMASFADERQARATRAIEEIVSAGLSSVFGEEIELRLTPTTRARRPELDITVRTGDLETPNMEARGGGLAQVAGLLLKVTTLLLTRGARRLIVADEPLGMLSAEYAPRAAEFLAELCERTGLQLIVVTHDDALTESADRVIRLKPVKGEAKAMVEK